MENNTFEQISNVLAGMHGLLKEKNIRYGNSALEPANIFSKLDAKSSILIRLDDKIKRVQNSTEIRPNDISDIIGYCVLLLVSMGVTKEDILTQID